MQSSSEVSRQGVQASHAWLSSGDRILSPSLSVSSHRENTRLRYDSPNMSGACHATDRQIRGQGARLAPSHQTKSLHHAFFLLSAVLLSDLHDLLFGPTQISDMGENPKS
jgi:hypothetical protein